MVWYGVWCGDYGAVRVFRRERDIMARQGGAGLAWGRRVEHHLFCGMQAAPHIRTATQIFVW